MGTPASLSQEKDTTLKQVKLPFPSVASSSPVAPPDVPVALSSLILSGATEPEAFALMYTGGRTGYRIEFRIATDLAALQQTYRTALNGNGWTITNDTGNSPFAFIEAQNDNFRIRIEITRYTTASVVNILSIAE